MHEMALAERVLEIVEEAARTHGAVRVTGVMLELGALSCVEPDAMRFCFDAVVRDTVAQGARLEIATRPAGGWCPECVREVVLAGAEALCPKCGGARVRVNCGYELRVSDIEIE